MNKFGPTRGEIIFRLVFSLAGLGLLAVALLIHGIPRGPALVETVGLAGVFFGGTTIWSIRKLMRMPKD